MGSNPIGGTKQNINERSGNVVFHLDDFKGKIVMKIKTPSEYDEFTQILHKAGLRWCTGRLYLGYIPPVWQDGMCINFNEGMYAEERWFKEHGYIVLEWSDFKTE